MTDRSTEFERNGWILVDFATKARDVLQGTRDRLLSHLRKRWIPELDSLESYHLHIDDDDQHIEIQYDLTLFFQKEGFGLDIIKAETDIFLKLVGQDLHLQKYPYLRIARPDKPQDNIGIHRDTHYGCTPYELSVHIPFTDVSREGSLAVLTGSHILPETAFPVVQRFDPAVEKGSKKHKLGFLYAPKELGPEIRSSVKPVHTRVGQCLVFSLSLLHGQEVNCCNSTRISTDLRVVNSLAPIRWERNVHKDYYFQLCKSAVTAQAREYYRAEGEKTEPNNSKA